MHQEDTSCPLQDQPTTTVEIPCLQDKERKPPARVLSGEAVRSVLRGRCLGKAGLYGWHAR